MAPLHSPRQIGALFRGEYLGGFNQGGGNALRRSVGQFHLFAAQRLDFSMVDRGGGEGLPDLLTPGEMLLPQRIDIVGSEPCRDGRREGARVVAGEMPVVREVGKQLRITPLPVNPTC